MNKNLKQIFTVLFALSFSLCVTGHTPDSAEALTRLLGRDNAVWETKEHDGKFLYFRSDGTGVRSVRTKTSDDVRKQFVWKAISPTQLTLKFNKRAKLDTITIMEALPDNVKVKYGNHIYDYIASYDPGNSQLRLADMIWHPGGISETPDKVSISSLERQWGKTLGDIDSHPGDRGLHFVYVHSRPRVILDGVEWCLGNIQFSESEYWDKRTFHYSASPENVTQTVNTLKNWLAGSTAAFIEDGRVDVALLGTTGTGHNIYAKIYTDDKYVSLDIEFNKEKEHVPTAEEIRRQHEFDRMIRETDALIQQCQGIPTPSAQSQTVPVTVIIPPVYPVAPPTVGTGSTGTSSRRHCQTCYGTGVCQTCGGDGIATNPYGLTGSTTKDYECPNCKQGHPRSDWGKCAVCHGTGKLGK